MALCKHKWCNEGFESSVSVLYKVVDARYFALACIIQGFVCLSIKFFFSFIFIVQNRFMINFMVLARIKRGQIQHLAISA